MFERFRKPAKPKTTSKEIPVLDEAATDQQAPGTPPPFPAGSHGTHRVFSDFGVSDFQRVFGGSPFGKQSGGSSDPDDVLNSLGALGVLLAVSETGIMPFPTYPVEERILWASGCAQVEVCPMLDDFIIELPSDPADTSSERKTVRVAITTESYHDYLQTVEPLTEEHHRKSNARSQHIRHSLNVSVLDEAARRIGKRDLSALHFRPADPDSDFTDRLDAAHTTTLEVLRAFIERHGGTDVADDTPEKEETEAPATETSSDS